MPVRGFQLDKQHCRPLALCTPLYTTDAFRTTPVLRREYAAVPEPRLALSLRLPLRLPSASHSSSRRNHSSDSYFHFSRFLLFVRRILRAPEICSRHSFTPSTPRNRPCSQPITSPNVKRRHDVKLQTSTHSCRRHPHLPLSPPTHSLYRRRWQRKHSQC